MLKIRGVELIRFSPIHDQMLPDSIDGIYIGGGYPELHLKALSQNKAMLQAIKNYSDNGLPIYAECGGLMYLGREIKTLENESYQMVGVFDSVSEMTNRLQHFGYVDVEFTADCLLGQKGTRLTGHEFHRSKTTFNSAQLIYDVKKSTNPTKKWRCGANTNCTLGAYTHIHFKQYQHALAHWISIMEKKV